MKFAKDCWVIRFTQISQLSKCSPATCYYYEDAISILQDDVILCQNIHADHFRFAVGTF